MVTGCPYDAITPDVRALIRLCDFADKGNLPRAGGVLDQTASFADGLEFVRWERRRCENEIAARRKR